MASATEKPAASPQPHLLQLPPLTLASAICLCDGLLCRHWRLKLLQSRPSLLLHPSSSSCQLTRPQQLPPLDYVPLQRPCQQLCRPPKRLLGAGLP